MNPATLISEEYRVMQQKLHENPNYGVPLDGVRDTQNQGMLGTLHPYFYSIPGSFGQISVMQNIGKEILKDLKAEGINGALLVST